MPGGGAAKRRGTRYENELANILWERGFAVIRAPSSGGGSSKRFQPDLVALKQGIVIVLEVKSVKPGRRVYIDRRRVELLKEFARRSGGRVFIALKTLGEGWRLHPLESLEETRNGNYRVPRAGGLRLRDLEAIIGGVRRLDDFMGE